MPEYYTGGYEHRHNKPKKKVQPEPELSLEERVKKLNEQDPKQRVREFLEGSMRTGEAGAGRELADLDNNEKGV